MKTPLTAASAALITIFATGASDAIAQAFDTSPQYQSYTPAQAVPRVNLPRLRTDGSGLAPTTTPDTLTTTKSAARDPEPNTTARPANAGAIDKATGQGTNTPSPTVATGTAPAPAADQQKYPAGTVLEGSTTVYDGQNILISGAPVRLDGAEAPAIGQNCYTRQGLVWKCGEKAAQRLAEIVSAGAIRCTVTEPLGNGAAAICSARGVSDITSVLVSEGLAVRNGHDDGRYAVQQSIAKAGNRGLWIGPFEAPWTWRIRNGQ